MESDLIYEFKNGSERAFRIVFNEYYAKLLYFVDKILNNKQEAEDIVLMAFQALFARCTLFNSNGEIQAFLYVTARNKALNYIKHRDRKQRRFNEFAKHMEDDTLLIYEYSIKTELIEAIHVAIEQLPEDRKRIFKLAYFEQLSPKEIALRLNISKDTVYTQLRRVLNSFKTKLKVK